jgi:hypothetical protein
LVKPLLRKRLRRERPYLAKFGLINTAECAPTHPSPAPPKDAVGQARDMFNAEGFSVIHEAA